MVLLATGCILIVISYMQVPTVPLSAYILLLITLGIIIISAYVHHAHIRHVKGAKPHANLHKASAKLDINWHKIRHLWLE